MEDEELVKMFNPILKKKKKTILFFLIVVINWLICIDLDIMLDSCVRQRRRKEMSKKDVLFSRVLDLNTLYRGNSPPPMYLKF